jgi:hypothetical protein
MPPSRGPVTRALGALLAVAVAVTGLMSVTATAARAVGDGSLGIRLTEAPTSRADDPRARVYVVDHVLPGTAFTRHVEISNDTDQTRSIRVYAGPASIRNDAWTPAAPGKRSELTNWINPGRDRIELAAHRTAVVPVTFTVPRDASQGERYGVVWASTASTGRGSVTMVSRVGIRVYLSVGPGGEPPTTFRLSGLRAARAADGSPQVVATVTNTGGRAVDLEGELRMSDGPGGLSAGPFETDDGSTLAPGDRGTVVTTLDHHVPAGPWTARLRVWSGEARQRLTGTLTFPEDGAAPSHATAGGGSGMPWWAWGTSVLLLLLALLLLLLLERRRRRARATDAVDGPARRGPGFGLASTGRHAR